MAAMRISSACFSLGVAFAALLATACGKDGAESACFETGGTPKVRVSACGELCDKDNGKACAVQTEVATEHCMKKGDAEICRWMCDYAKSGADLYCKQKEALDRGGAAPAGGQPPEAPPGEAPPADQPK